jgi:DNA-binding XRE family transcriptional regulator
MAMTGKIKAKPTLKDFLNDVFGARKSAEWTATRSEYTKKEFAEEVGINAQTLKRYMEGDEVMTLDNAIPMIMYFGEPILAHLELDPKVLDHDAAVILARWKIMNDNQRKAIRRQTELFSKPGGDKLDGINLVTA